LLLRPVNWACRIILFCLGVYWIEEVYPPGTRCMQFGYLRRSDSARIIVPNHCSFIDAFYFGARFLPVAVVRRRRDCVARCSTAALQGQQRLCTGVRIVCMVVCA
jgi:hypothetical protein